MKSLLVILIAFVLVSFGWGWLMDVHYGHLSTDQYFHEYVLKIENIYDGVAEKTQDMIHDISKAHIIRPHLKMVTD